MAEEKRISTEEAQSLLQKDRDLRSAKAMQEINAILKRERCKIIPMLIIRGGNITQQIEVVAE